MWKWYSLNMMEPPLCPPDGYYRWRNHEQEFSDKKDEEVNTWMAMGPVGRCSNAVKASNVEVNTSATINFAGLLFGVGCLLYTLISSRKK